MRELHRVFRPVCSEITYPPQAADPKSCYIVSEATARIVLAMLDMWSIITRG
jgi:hypothetical protein